MKGKKILGALIFAVLLFGLGGCTDWQSFISPVKEVDTPLLHVEISFSENEHLTGYVKTMGLEEDVKIYVGGASVNHLYDKQGQVIATFNYARVNYIKLIPEPDAQNR